MSGRLLAGLAALVLSVTAATDARAVAVFEFAGLCDDCAFDGSPSDPGFDPFDDGLTQPVTGRLVLTDATPDASGLVVIDAGNFESFTYDGSSLLNPRTFDATSTASGTLMADGDVVDTVSIILAIGFIPDFCTDRGREVLGSTGCDGILSATFTLNQDETWTVAGRGLSDVGSAGTLTRAGQPVPEPWLPALVGAGLLALRIARRRRA